MVTSNHYSKAPITEAIIDLRIPLGEGFSFENLQKLHDEIKERYPEKAELKEARLRVELSEDHASHQHDATKIGYAFKSVDEKYVFQARVDGLTLGRLAPYETWSALVTEFTELWGKWAAIANPTLISRIAVRYLNRLDLPLPFSDFKEYILTCPEVAPGLPQSLSGFLMQLHIPQQDMKCMLILTEAILPPAREGVASMLLDIDLFKDSDIPVDFRPLLDEMHDRKNKIFESCITDKTRELIR